MRWKVLTVVGLLYTAQFIPLFFSIMALPIILRMAGHTATLIGLVQLAALPYIFKFLWAPWIDRYRLGKDRYKSWIVVLSVLHVVSVVGLALTDPGGNLVALFIMLSLAILAVSTQDVAVDALAISLLRPSERTLGSTFQNAGAYAGAIVGGFGFLYIYDELGWTAALIIQAVLFALPLLALALVDEPARLRGAPTVNFRNAFQFFKQERIGRWLGVLGTIRIPILMTMLPMRLMMVDQGMTTEEIAIWFGLFAMCAAGGATVIFGPLLRKLPRVQAIYFVGFLNIPILVLIAYIASQFPNGIRYAIILGWFGIALTDVVMYRGAMDKVRPEMPGFDFSVQIAIYMLLAGFADPIVGVVIDRQGYLPALLTAIPLAVVPLLIVYFRIARISESARGLDGERAVSTGHMKTRDSMALLKSCEKSFSEDHGIQCTWPEPSLIHMESMGCIVEMRALENAVDLLIDTPTESYLVFIREELFEHLEEFDRAATETLSWTGGITVGEMPSNFRILRASRRREVYPGLIRVTLTGIDVESLNREGIHIRLMMPAARGREPVWPTINENGRTVWPKGNDQLHTRYVTIRHLRLDDREIDVDIAHHDGGLISDWAALDGDDQKVGVMGPVGDPGLDFTENVILAADTTGLPAIARLIESVDGRVTGHLFAAAPSQAVLEDYLPNSQLKVTAVDPSEFSTKILDLVKDCAKEPISYGWFAGEFGAARAMRDWFRDELSLEKTAQLSAAYWKVGVAGHHR
ncbi:MAG: MFS transporter [Pseudomonadota bacterium]